MKQYLGIIFVILCVVAGGWKYYTSTPEYALKQIHKAFDEADRRKLDQFAMVDKIINDVVDELIAQKMLPGFKGQVMQIVEMEMKHIFTSSSLVRKRIGPSRYDKIKDDISFVDEKKENCSSQECTLSVTIRDNSRARTLVILAKFSKSSEGWKLTELPRIVDIIRQHLEY